MDPYFPEFDQAIADRERMRLCGTETTWEKSAPLLPPNATPALVRVLWPQLEAVE